MKPADPVPADVAITALHPLSAEAAYLLAASDAMMRALYPGIEAHLESAAALAAAPGLMLGVWQGGQCVACGAVKHLLQEDGQPVGEIKRVFVLPQARRQGLARRLMQHLEQSLCEQGIGWARLETGVHQPEALALYASLGYQRCAAFGAYQANATGVLMLKRLSAAPATARPRPPAG